MKRLVFAYQRMRSPPLYMAAKDILGNTVFQLSRQSRQGSVILSRTSFVHKYAFALEASYPECNCILSLCTYFFLCSRIAMLPSTGDDGEKRGHLILIISWIACMLALVFVSARFYTRTKLVRNAGWDDGAILATLVPTLFLEMA